MSAVIKPELITFRPMTEDDLEEILLIENIVYDFPWNKTIFNDCLRVGYSCWVILNYRNEIDAYGIMSVAAGECHILNLCVHPQTQGIGLGKKLLYKLLLVAKKHHADTAFLEVRPSNKIAITLYSNSGFNEVGMRRNYYPAKHGREDAIIMAAIIND
ncbi:MAG: ribosomal protein S18-alanine N-acetyltransferase [Gammaproteobacteria bacterium]|jgi:ribosomal-protein-alanine N-acetyltransferase